MIDDTTSIKLTLTYPQVVPKHNKDLLYFNYNLGKHKFMFNKTTLIIYI